MDPLSITASVIGIATLAAQSARATYNIIDGLVEAPRAVANSKIILQGTQTTLNTLQDTLEKYHDREAKLESVLKLLAMDKTLVSTQELCVNFSDKITEFTRRSTNERFSHRDRILINLQESQITNLKEQLSSCQQTILLMIGTITLIVSSDTSATVQQLSGRFETQENALSTMITELSNTSTISSSVAPQVSDRELLQDTAEEERARLQRTTVLQDACQAALRATRAERTGQTFGDMHVDQSMAMQGIVGQAQEGVHQTFGKLTAQNNSRAFAGQMDASSFAWMFN